MRKTNWIVVVLGVCFFMSSLYAHITPSLICVAVAFLTFFSLASALLVTGIIGFVRWRKSSRLWMMPALVCLAFLSSAWINTPIGVFIADRQFKSHLNEYVQVVDDIKSGAIPCGARLAVIDVKKCPTDIIRIKAARCSDGAMVVAFLIGTDVPLLHEGYVFKGYSETDNCITEDIRPEQQWPYVRHVVGSWYHFSDQPGL